MAWQKNWTTKFGLWVETHLSTDNTLHGNGRAIEKRDIFLQVDEKAAEIDNSDLTCHVFSLEDVVAYLAISNPNNH